MAMTDGVRALAMLDRNGLRPSRYLVTTDGLLVMASETGALDLPPERVLRRDRLRPGRMLMVDTDAGRLLDDVEIKGRMASLYPYDKWIAKLGVDLADLPAPLRSRIPRLFGSCKRPSATRGSRCAT